jgi:hypothetical protein
VISRRIVGEDFHSQIWEERAFFFFGTCERGAFLLIWAHPPISLCVLTIEAELGLFLCVSSWAGRDLAGYQLLAACCFC